MDKYYICILGTLIADPLGKVLYDKQAGNVAWDYLDPAFGEAVHDLVDGHENAGRVLRPALPPSTPAEVSMSADIRF